MSRHRLVSTLFTVSALAAAQPAVAQEGEVELAYDDGAPSGTLTSLSEGDIELTRFTPAHPAELLSVRLHFADTGCRAKVFVWADNGGNAADVEQVLWQTEVDVEAEGWLELELPAGAVTLDPPRHFYVGHQLGPAPACQLSWDASGADETRSLARIDGSWYHISAGSGSDQTIDALVRARVRYFDVLERRAFEEVTAEAGLPAGMRRMAWGDYDDDGDDDLLVNGGRLFRNEGDGTFVEVTDEAGVGGRSTNGGVWADFDNDGWLDFYATVNNYLPPCESDDDCLWCTLRSNPDGSRECDEVQRDHHCVEGRCTPPSGERLHDLLWHNEGDGSFTEVSIEAGAPHDYLPTEAAAWGDYDGDGLVDLYVANYETPQGWVEGRLSVGTRDALWRNLGDGAFEDVTAEVGLGGFVTEHCGRGVSWADFDLDGDLDLYVANYRLQFNYFYENLGEGTFEYIGHDNGTAGQAVSGSYGHSIGAAWADVENDGDWDLFVANLAHPRFIEFSDKSLLYLSGGAPGFEFEERRAEAGITYSETHSNPSFGDYDNDGDPDLFITDVYVGYLAFLYRNEGDGTFTDVTYPSGIDVDNGWGSAWADYDLDGDLDLVTRSLWRNRGASSGHWLEVRLRGTTSNAAAIGAVVQVTAGSGTMMRQVEGGSGTGVQSSLALHFGLGEAEAVDELVLRWPSGLEERYLGLEADQRLLYWEGGEPPGEPDGGADGGVEPDADRGVGSFDATGGGCQVAAGRSGSAAVLGLLGLVAAGFYWGWRRR